MHPTSYFDCCFGSTYRSAAGSSPVSPSMPPSDDPVAGWQKMDFDGRSVWVNPAPATDFQQTSKARSPEPIATLETT
jgi:hypothetical protein